MTKYETLARTLTKQLTRNLQNGISKLPTESQLCSEYNVSRQTVRAALNLLSKQGLITSRQGSGSYATGLSADSDLNIIPILAASQQEYIYPQLLSDIRMALSEHGYKLQIYPTDNNTSIERTHLLTLLVNPPRGLIVEGCKSTLPNPNLDLYEKLRESGTFILFLHNYYSALQDCIYVKDDNYYGGCLLAEHLISLGHTRIAGLFKMDDLQGPERYHGTASRLRDLGYPLSDNHVGWYSSPDIAALETRQDTRFLTDFIQDRLVGCSAVVCYNDEIAYWLIKELSYANIHVPQDLSVVGFDNSYLSELSSVRITTLTHAPHEISECVAECVIGRLQGISVVSHTIPWQLVRKESDAPYSANP